MTDRSRKYLYYISVIFFFSFFAFSSLLPRQAECYSLPNWFLNPPANSEASLFGVGQGNTLDEATKEALNHVAGTLSTTIASEWEKKETQRGNGGGKDYSSEINNRINSKVGSITFNNHEIVNNEVVNGKFYILVAVDKKKFVAEKLNDLFRTDSAMDSIFSAAQGKSIVERIADLRKVSRQVPAAISLANIISSLDPSFDARSHFDKYNRYLGAERAALNEVRIHLVYAKASEDLIAVVKEHLNNANLKVIDEADNDSNTVSLLVQTDIKKLQIYNSKMVKLNTKFELRSSRNDLVASSRIETKGASMISYPEAIRAAAVDFDTKLKQQGILQLLGLSAKAD